MIEAAIKSIRYSKMRVEDRINDLQSKYNTENDGVKGAINRLKSDLKELENGLTILEENKNK